MRNEKHLQATPPSNMTVKDIARELQVSARTAHDLWNDPVDPIPSFRVGSGNKLRRTRRADFETWVARQMKNSGDVDRIVREVLS